MSAPIVFAKTQGMSRKEWLELRRKGIGGSDAAGILGLNPHSSPLAVWVDKTGAGSEEEEENEFIWLGNVLEEHVARRYASESGLQIVRMNQMLQHPEHTFMLANIDRRVKGKRIGVEIKTTQSRKWDFEGGEIAPWYYAQCMHYLAVTGWEKWILVVLVIGKGMYTFEILPNQEEIDALIHAEGEFWNNHVLANKPPEVDGTEASEGILKTRYPKSNGESCVLDCESDITEFMSIDEKIKELEKQRDLHKQRIMERMGEAERGETANFTVTWKTCAPKKSIDSKRLKEDMPNVYDQYLKESAPYRRFSIKDNREE